MRFQCPHCLIKYETRALLATHMEKDENMSAAWVSRWIELTFPQASSPPEIKVESSGNIKIESPGESKVESLGQIKVESPGQTKVETAHEESVEPPPAVNRFRVWFVLDEDNVHRREIPKNETFGGFCYQLKSLYYQAGWVFEIDQFEYVLIEKKYHRMEVIEPLWDAESYYRMVRTLVGLPSHWRHAIVRKRTVSIQCNKSVTTYGLTFLSQSISAPIRLPPLIKPIMAKDPAPETNSSIHKGTSSIHEGTSEGFQPARAPPAPPTRSATAAMPANHGLKLEGLSRNPSPAIGHSPTTFGRPILPSMALAPPHTLLPIRLPTLEPNLAGRMPTPVPVPMPVPMPAPMPIPAHLFDARAQDQAHAWATGPRLHPIMPAITVLKPTSTLMPPFVYGGRPRLPGTLGTPLPTTTNFPWIGPGVEDQKRKQSLAMNQKSSHEEVSCSYDRGNPATDRFRDRKSASTSI